MAINSAVVQPPEENPAYLAILGVLISIFTPYFFLMELSDPLGTQGSPSFQARKSLQVFHNIPACTYYLPSGAKEQATAKSSG
ncbi:hypothetical protein HBA55_05750 [Pseudomaricurvus alkylphenolicus]|uniref:hypothetical protein n=1 Tax=Pseudomaricurvus alkylphenolicus TaxID=1306991 RepID=UPI0014247736|nr:hypothetical protein [Pseudomaricurvus alkylphenolicus]NIB39079.1 hypothetical protein [Pseudomaricurvus alkylphenolicus]